MLSLIVLTLLSVSPSLSTTSTSIADHLFSNPAVQSGYGIPTIRESAVLARRMLNLSSIGTLSSVFPPSNSLSSVVREGETPMNPTSPYPDGLHASSAQPRDIAGSPIGLMEYYATCDPSPYNPTILAISIATYIRNAHSGSNISLSLRWHPPPSAPPSSDPYLYSPANMPRFSLQGYIEPITEEEVEGYRIKHCFLERHKEVIWTPGNDIHESWWGRIVVEGVYWFGGFGDRARIGWIPIEVWRSVTDEEIEKARLVGEEGYKPPIASKPKGSEEL